MSEPVLDIRRPSPHVAEVWLNRPDVRNAFNDGVIAALTEAFARLNQDADLRVVLLAGHGKAFCAGADLNWMRAMADYSWEENRADAQKLADMLWTLDQCPVPVVGRVHGDCYAGGMGLASVCDVLVASDNVTFCLSEARLGLLPATIGPYVVRAMGEQASRRYFTTAERFSAAQAQAMGFVHELCTPRNWMPVWQTSFLLWWTTAPPRCAPASGWSATWRPARWMTCCVPRPRAASPTSAPATKGGKACSPS
jgi:methylglutaconyl-CoA hydratase